MLRMELKVGQSVRIGTATVTVEEKTGRTTRLAIDADSSVPIRRVEHKSPSQIAAMGITAKPA